MQANQNENDWNKSEKQNDDEHTLGEDDPNQKDPPDDSVKASTTSKMNKDLDIFSNHALVQKASKKLSIKQSPNNIEESKQETMFQDNQNVRRMIKTSAQQRAFTQ